MYFIPVFQGSEHSCYHFPWALTGIYLTVTCVCLKGRIEKTQERLLVPGQKCWEPYSPAAWVQVTFLCSLCTRGRPWISDWKPLPGLLGMGHHSWFMVRWGLNPGSCACWACMPSNNWTTPLSFLLGYLRASWSLGCPLTHYISMVGFELPVLDCSAQ